MKRSERASYVAINLITIVVLLANFYLPDIIKPKAQRLDFRGYVDTVEIDWEKETAVITAYYINSEAKAKIKASTNVSCIYLDGNNFPINSLRKGDMIDLDYKRGWGLDLNDGIMKAEAKWITVCPLR